MPITIVNIQIIKNRSRYLLLPILVGIVTAIASVPFVASASESQAATWSGWAALDTIVVVSPTDEYLDLAATELQDYLGQISGRSWSITYTDPGGPAVRLVVDPANANLTGRNDDSVHLLTDSTGITITGRSTLAARHGAYILLEDLGVKWLSISDYWTVVPSSLDPLTLGLDRVEEPFFVDRSIVFPTGYVAGISDDAVLRSWAWTDRNRLESWGDYLVRHSWADFANKFDVAAQDPTAVCYKEDGISPQQVLPYHQVTIDRALAYARDWFDNDPTGGRRIVVPISPPDGNMIWCDEWRVDGSYHSETISNYAFELTNVVARMLQIEYPGKLAGVYSYSNYSDVPTIDLEPNVIVGVTTFTRGTQTLEQRIAGFKAKNVYLNYRDYFDVWPWWKDRVPPAGKIDFFLDTIPFAVDNGFDTFRVEGSDGWAPKARLYWTTSQMLWDPTADPDQVMDEFYTAAFGPARDVMDRFYTRLDTQTHNNRIWGLSFRDLEEALDIANSAGDTQVATRINEIIQHTYFWWKWGDRVEASHTGFNSVDDAKDFYSFVSAIKNLHIITWRSHEEIMRPILENTYALTTAEVDALAATAPHSNADVQAILDTTLTTWSGQDLIDGIYNLAHWKFDEASGSVAIDSSGNNYSGTLINSPTWQAGQLSGALAFNGIDDRLELPSSVLDGQSELTISFWLNTTTSWWQSVISAANSTNRQALRIVLNSGAELRFHTGNGIAHVAWPVGNIADGNWHHYAFTRNAGEKQITAYLDGISLGTIDLNYTIEEITVDTGGLFIGMMQDGPGTFNTRDHLNGALDDFRIYSGILTPTQINSILNGNIIPNGRISYGTPAPTPTPVPTATPTPEPTIVVPPTTVPPTPTPVPTTAPTVVAVPPTPTPVPTTAPTVVAVPPTPVPAPSGGGGFFVPPPPTPTAEPTVNSEPTATAVVGTIPNRPISIKAIAGDGQALLEIVAPISDGGREITGYGVLVTPGNHQVYLDADQPLIVPGLENGKPVRFTVYARNAIGGSTTGAMSNIIVPQAGLALPTATPEPTAVKSPSDGTDTPTPVPASTSDPAAPTSDVVPATQTPTPAPTVAAAVTPEPTPVPTPVVVPTATAIPAPVPTVQPTAVPTAAPTATAAPVVFNAPSDLDGPTASQTIKLTAGWIASFLRIIFAIFDSLLLRVERVSG